MTDQSPSDAADASAALAAFLRGIERRGVVFADLHSGDPAAGDQAYAIALGHFRTVALQQPFARWPRLFWGALLGTQPLRTGVAAARWPGPFAALGQVGSGPRAALLLRLVAGLTDAEAAAVLGIARPTYRLALQRALPHAGDGEPDPAAWRALGEAAQQAVRQLPAERLAHMARLREASVQGRRPELIGPWVPAPPAQARPAPSRRRWVMPALWAGVVACALSLGATFAPWPRGGSAHDDPSIETVALPPPEPPAAAYDAATAVLTERDFELLAEPESDPLLREFDFLGWAAAGHAQERGQARPEPPEPPDTSGMPETEAADAL